MEDKSHFTQYHISSISILDTFQIYGTRFYKLKISNVITIISSCASWTFQNEKLILSLIFQIMVLLNKVEISRLKHCLQRVQFE